MSHSSNPSLQPPAIDSLSTRFTNSLTPSDDAINKPDFRELDLGSPVSPLNSRAPVTSTSNSSSSSSGSVPGKPTTVPPQLLKRPDNASRSHSGELLRGSETNSGSASATLNRKPGHRRSVSAGQPLIYSGSSFSSAAASHIPTSSVTSPAPPPIGNICPSGKILKTGMSSRVSTRTDSLCTGTGNYGHGSIVRGGGGKPEGNPQKHSDPEEVKMAGNEMYRRGNFVEALAMYDRAIALSPSNAAFWSNRAAALTALGRLGEAVKDCQEAVRLDPTYARAHHRLFHLYFRLGLVENARHHLHCTRQCPDSAELYKLSSLEKHLIRCANARRIGDWKSALREVDAAIAVGADSSPSLVAGKAEAFLKLHQIGDAASCLSNIPKFDCHPVVPTKFFGMVTESYILYVEAQVEMTLGRFENAVSIAEKAASLESNNNEISTVINTLKMVASARTRGNNYFSSGRYSEACSAYGEGLKYDNSNSVLYCNRAVCWSKLELWEKSVEDCSRALQFQPNYTKALLRRAASYQKLGRWAEAVRDYEVLKKELPEDKEVTESLKRSQAALHESRLSLSTGFNNEVEEICSLDKFKSAMSYPGVSVIYFKAESSKECEDMSPFINTLCIRYPIVHFFKVDIEESLAVAKFESIKSVPTYKIYKNGERVKELVRPNHRILEESVKTSIL